VTIELDVQRATRFRPQPEDSQIALWVETALAGGTRAILTVRIVGRGESRRLNGRYRGKDRATNVLSFPADLPEQIGLPLLGDVVICAPLVVEEAKSQGKSVEAHWAHLTIHGVLHLLGYDHQQSADAAVMEELEIALLDSLGLPDPYA